MAVAGVCIVTLAGFSIGMAMMYGRATRGEEEARSALTAVRAEQRRAEAARRLAEAERARAEAALQVAEAERARAEAALEQVERARRREWQMRLEAARLRNEVADARGNLTLKVRVPEVRVEQVPLELALEWIQELTQVQIVVAWSSLAIVGVQRDTPVSVEATNKRVAEVLEDCLASASGGRDLIGYSASETSVFFAGRTYLAEVAPAAGNVPGSLEGYEVRLDGVVDEVPATRFRLQDQHGRQLNAASLLELVTKLQEITGLEFACHWDELAAVGVSQDTPVIVRVKEPERLASAVDHEGGAERPEEPCGVEY